MDGVPRGTDCFVIGLDIGQSVDFSALTVLTRHYEVPEENEIPTPGTTAVVKYVAVEGYRFPLGTEYECVVATVAAIWERPLVQSQQHYLVVDQTGIGGPVVEMIRRRHIRTIGCNITGGTAITKAEIDTFNVPKSFLVTNLIQYFQSGKIKIAFGGAEAEELKRQLGSFGYKIDRITAHISYESLEEKVHDDMVISLSLALWYASTQVYGLKYGNQRRAHIAEPYHPFEKRKELR